MSPKDLASLLPMPMGKRYGRAVELQRRAAGSCCSSADSTRTLTRENINSSRLSVATTGFSAVAMLAIRKLTAGGTQATSTDIPLVRADGRCKCGA